MYKIVIDTARNLVQVTLAGLMQPDEVRRYMADLRHEMVSHRITVGYALSIDVSDCTIQTQDMIATMGEQMKAMPKAGAIAIIAEKQLARMQIKRLFQQSYARVVANSKEALAWVLEGVEPLSDSSPAVVR